MRGTVKARPRGRAFFMGALVATVLFLFVTGLAFGLRDCDMTVEEAERLGEEFGIIVGEVDEEIRKQLSLTRAQGVVVFEVIGGTDADLSGIKVKAVVKEIDKVEVRNMQDFGCALKRAMGTCGYTVGTYEPATPDTQGVGGVINFHLVRCLKD